LPIFGLQSSDPGMGAVIEKVMGHQPNRSLSIVDQHPQALAAPAKTSGPDGLRCASLLYALLALAWAQINASIEPPITCYGWRP
jgi:hypothetical protein